MDTALFTFLGCFVTFLIVAELAGSLWSTFWEYIQ